MGEPVRGKTSGLRLSAEVGRVGGMRVRGWQHEIGGARWWARLLSYGALVGALLGLFGPFGSFLNGSFLVLLVHWTLMTILGAATAGLFVPRITDFGTKKGLPVVFALVLALLLVSIPIAAISSIEARWLWPWQTARLRAIDWYVQTLVILTVATGGWIVLEIAKGQWGENAMAAAEPPASRDANSTCVICLQMEDHYVRVHDDTGSTLELMTLQNAISRYGGNGLQVHRSWWVATGSVISAHKEGRNWRLYLSNGLSAPVARNRIAAVRAHGLIGR
jgi:hypothetical protein